MEMSATLKLVVASIAFVIISDVMGPGVSGCPAVCLCYVDEGGLRTANCTGVKFTSENKYSKVFHEIEVLSIRPSVDNEQIKLWDDMFMSFTKLKLLNLQNCRINYLPKNVFKGLKKIFEINLSSNDIRHFDNGVFENIYSLNKLNLRGNRLQGSYKPFISSSSLRELDLGYCGITVLQNEFFHGVKKLNRLYLDGNHLQTVKEHILPSKISHLNLANNRIVNVPISTINSLSQLRWLDLGANPINCTCALMNLQDMLSGHGIIIDGDLRCAYPPELENISLSKVNENEVCNRETFNSRYHFKKTQTTKYAPYQKKDYIFENEKYDPFEIQGDDPGTDDYTDENENTEPKNVSETTNDELHTGFESKPEKHDIGPDNLVDGISDAANTENHGSDDKRKPLPDNTFPEKPMLHSLGLNISDLVNNDENKDTQLEDEGVETASQDKVILENDSHDQTDKPVNDDGESEKNAKGVDLTNISEEKDTTQTPFLSENEDDIDIPLDVDNEKSGTEIFDENMKSDQVMPVGELSLNGHTLAIPDNNHSTEKIQNIVNISHVEDTHTTSKEFIDKIETKSEISVGSENVTDEKNKQTEKPGPIDPVEVEGSGAGSEEITIANASIPIVDGDEIPDPIAPVTTEEPIHKVEIYSVETTDIEKSTTDESENIGQIVNKKPISYEEMGPHIVVGCIIIFITILILITLYKGLCKTKETNRKPARDAEANNATELQDITSSLLPKSPINDDKHNSKYPNEAPSPETVNLIKVDKAEEANERNGPHDLNQNDNKSEPIIKNGKHVEGSPPPIEKTKAKLTVLLESIPRTPIFLQKRPATLNNG